MQPISLLEGHGEVKIIINLLCVQVSNYFIMHEGNIYTSRYTQYSSQHILTRTKRDGKFSYCASMAVRGSIGVIYDAIRSN